MRQSGQTVFLGATLVAAALASALPARGLEIFGIRLWGEDEEEGVEVIDPLPYAVEMSVTTDDEDLARELQRASALWRDRENPASGFAGLLATARGDYRRLLAALYGRGYYGPAISITLGGTEADELSLAEAVPAPVPVAIAVDPGPRFTFGVADIVNAPPWEEAEGEETGPASVDFVIGEPAEAGAIAAASALAVERWRQLSRAKAEEVEREIIADHGTGQLEAVVVIDPDRAARYGPVTVSGSRRVDPRFVEYMTDLAEGEPFDPDDLDEAEARLGRLGTVRLIRIEEGEEIGPDGRLPMSVIVEDRLPRSFGVGASYSTIDGLGLEAFWLHRNLFGRAEQLRFDATIAGIGSEALADLTYEIGTTFIRPGVIEPDTNLVASLVGRKRSLETYDETAVTGRIGLSRGFGSEFTGDLFLEVTRSEVEDDAFGTREFLTFGPELGVTWDRRDDDVDPTGGFLLAAEVSPFYEAEFGNPAVRGTLEGRAYYGLGAEDRFVLAGRARVGSYFGPSLAESPPDQLFFAGGGGSIRGYESRSIGVETLVGGEPVVLGGSSLVETSAELRARVGERFGAVAFLDAGRVGEDSGFLGDGEWRMGAGLGVRYFTGFGPLRLDVATPIDRREEDSKVAVYIGLGQAF